MTISRSESSRINGSKSNGPVTDAGRAASSRNALKFGLFSKRRLIGDESQEDYDALMAAFASEHNPATASEWLLIDRMGMACVRRARVERAEAATIELQRNQYLYLSDREKWERYGGRALMMRLSQASDEALKEIAPSRDSTVSAALSLPSEPEKFVKLIAAIQREYDTALRLLRDEQSRRVSALPMRRGAMSDPVPSTVQAENNEVG
jgi:hypothetical protein